MMKFPPAKKEIYSVLYRAVVVKNACELVVLLTNRGRKMLFKVGGHLLRMKERNV